MLGLLVSVMVASAAATRRNWRAIVAVSAGIAASSVPMNDTPNVAPAENTGATAAFPCVAS